MSDFLQPHELQHARLPYPSPTPRVHPNSCPSSWWCDPAISSSVVPFSSCPQSLPASESFPMSQLFTWGGQSIGVSALASVLPVNTQDWSPSEWTGWISLQSIGLSRVFSSMWNRWPIQVWLCMKQGTQSQCTGTSQRDGEGCGRGFGTGGHMYPHGWFMSMYGKNHHNIVK